MQSSEYQCRVNLNIYDSPECTSLATQAAAGRHLRIVSPLIDDSAVKAIEICLCEDDYPGWLSGTDIDYLQEARSPYQPIVLSAAQIHDRLSAIIDFTHQAMQQPNEYLWGGTVGPNYDCSGLMQAAFAAYDIWLPRDAYQQEAFTQSINFSDLQPGNLIFFGNAKKATHVGLYLGEGRYIHSSGISQGRNGIGIDVLSENGDRVSSAYFRQLRGAGRVVASYQPQQNTLGNALLI